MSRLPEPETTPVTFEVLAEIAAGATARVDLCRVRSPADKAGKFVAVKRLHSHIAEDPQFADMFFDEVWLSAALRHKNVVEVEAWGTDPEGTFLAVELVQGVSLSRLMKTVFDTGEVFSERMVVYMASQLAQGLAAAHDLRSPDGELLQLVHRDLTPGNILCGFDGSLKITDFGLAKAKQRVTKTLTGLLKGSPQYMSPEQSRGLDIDRRSDLFSFGVVLFELFAGKRPWAGKSELQVMHEAQREPPLDLFQLRPRIDKELVSVCVRLLEKDPAERYQSAQEVGAKMLDWLAAHGYKDGNQEALARFVRRNAMRQMRWFERAIAGEISTMPDSMRPSHRPDRSSHAPPRLTMRSVRVGTSPGSVSTSPPRVRARSRKPLDSETTDVTDADAKVAMLHAKLKSGQAPKPPGSDELGDEVPTLVQKESRGQDYRAKAREVGAPRFPRRPVDMSAVEPAALIVDEDSDQRTTAIKNHRHNTAPTSLERRLRSDPSEIADPESEEIPTVPVKTSKAALIEAIHRAAASRAAASLPGQIVPPSPDVPPPPLRGAPMATGPRGTLAGIALDLTEGQVLAEADRLALEAVRLDEESKAAAAFAVRRATMARLANEAAMMAAEAVRVMGTAGIGQASLKLNEAYALEETMKQEDSAAPPPSVPPPPDPPYMQASAPTSASPQSPRDPFGRLDGEGRVSAPPGSSFLSRELARLSGFDPGSFRARLRPTLLGMPTLLALALAAFGVAALVVVIFLIAT